MANLLTEVPVNLEVGSTLKVVIRARQLQRMHHAKVDFFELDLYYKVIRFSFGVPTGESKSAKEKPKCNSIFFFFLKSSKPSQKDVNLSLIN